MIYDKIRKSVPQNQFSSSLLQNVPVLSSYQNIFKTMHCFNIYLPTVKDIKLISYNTLEMKIVI